MKNKDSMSAFDSTQLLILLVVLSFFRQVDSLDVSELFLGVVADSNAGLRSVGIVLNPNVIFEVFYL